MANMVVVADSLGLGSDSPVTPGATPSVTLVLSVSAWPVDGSNAGIRNGISVTKLHTSTAAQWRTDFITAIQAWMTVNGHTMIRLIGFVDLSTASF